MEPGLYHYAQTSDPAYCNPGSLVNGECSGGDIFFCKNGTVLYTLFCAGEDSEEVLIGKYKLSEKTIECMFDKEYSFFAGDSAGATNPNAGKLKTMDGISALTIHEINCTDFLYYFNLPWKDEGDQRYVLKQERKDNSDNYLEQLKKIKAIEPFVE